MPSEISSAKKKVCLLGAFGVGKTSLVRRFVPSEFDESYHSTIGVKVDKKVIEIEGCELTLVIWDVAGEEEFFQIPDSYVKGAHGFLFVADGTRGETLHTLQTIRSRFQESLGPCPEVVLLNKSDLAESWVITEDVEKEFSEAGIAFLCTSAADGRNVERAFEVLGRQLLDVG
jgi:small GTP-binding protein